MDYIIWQWIENSFATFCKITPPPPKKKRKKTKKNSHMNNHQKFHISFFFKVLGGHIHMSFFWGHWRPRFGFLVTSSLGFKARVGSALFAFSGGECNVHSMRSTSGATHADLLAADAPPVLSPHTVTEVRLLGFELVLSEYLWVRRSTNWAKPGPTKFHISWQLKTNVISLQANTYICFSVGIMKYRRGDALLCDGMLPRWERWRSYSSTRTRSGIPRPGTTCVSGRGTPPTGQGIPSTPAIQQCIGLKKCSQTQWFNNKFRIHFNYPSSYSLFVMINVTVADPENSERGGEKHEI